VSPGKEYDYVRDAVISNLQKLRDPDTGKTIEAEIHKRENIYCGDYVADAPDVLFLLDKGACIASNHWSDRLFDKPGRKYGQGFHRKKGMLVARGRGIKKNKKLDNARIIDMAPTILYSLGIGIPHDTDGSILHDIFEPGFKAVKKERYQTPPAKPEAEKDKEEAYSEEESKKIEDRLRGLGYL
jgi:predicted AlkP superfamily phosphohydrolase/phosphomutase